MPWDAGDVDQHYKGLSKKQKRKWASIANGALASCMDGGEKPEKDCAARAIKIANSKFDQELPFKPLMNGELADKIKAILKLENKKENGKVENKEELFQIDEMEIFRPGTHNGDDFTEDDLDEIASNFKELKDEVRPSLKITHRENQETLAGLARYGDVVEVFVKAVQDGSKRLFAKIINVPKQVMDFIKQRRFPERSIEIYPEFKLGTKEGSPVFKNVLKAIALLGHEMPAVTGMAPIKLEECLECQGTVCFVESVSEKIEKLEIPDDVDSQSKILEFEFRLLESERKSK